MENYIEVLEVMSIDSLSNTNKVFKNFATRAEVISSDLSLPFKFENVAKSLSSNCINVDGQIKQTHNNHLDYKAQIQKEWASLKEKEELTKNARNTAGTKLVEIKDKIDSKIAIKETLNTLRKNILAWKLLTGINFQNEGSNVSGFVMGSSSTNVKLFNFNPELAREDIANKLCEYISKV